MALTVKDSMLKCSQHKKFNSENCYQTSRLYQMVKYIFYNGQLDSYTMARVPPDVSLVVREQFLGSLPLHHLPAARSWNGF